VGNVNSNSLKHNLNHVTYVFLLFVNVTDLEPDVGVCEWGWGVTEYSVEAVQGVVELALLLVDYPQAEQNLVRLIKLEFCWKYKSKGSHRDKHRAVLLTYLRSFEAQKKTPPRRGREIHIGHIVCRCRTTAWDPLWDWATGTEPVGRRSTPSGGRPASGSNDRVRTRFRRWYPGQEF
jgi:hypothetical protein